MLGGYYTKAAIESQGVFDMMNKIDMILVVGLCGGSVGRAFACEDLLSMRASAQTLLASAVVLAYHIKGPTLRSHRNTWQAPKGEDLRDLKGESRRAGTGTLFASAVALHTTLKVRPLAVSGAHGTLGSGGFTGWLQNQRSK